VLIAKTELWRPSSQLSFLSTNATSLSIMTTFCRSTKPLVCGRSVVASVCIIPSDEPPNVTSKCSLNAIIFREKTSSLSQPKKMCRRSLDRSLPPITGDASPSASLAACAPSRSRP
jgi:hypothetical protein